jgi:predicted secreted protein
MEIEARRGLPFELDVEQYGAAGYIWQVESAPSAVREIDSTASSPGAGAAPGTPTTRTFRFVADQEGGYEIVLAAKRPWEGEPAERRTFRIVVKPGD